MFRIGSNELISVTANLTDVYDSDLQIAGLLDYCILPRVCAAHNDNDGEMFCGQVFPPALRFKEMIAFDVEAQLRDGDDPSSIKKVISSWTTALAQVKDDLVMPSRLQTLMNGVAAVCIVATLLSFALLPLTTLYLTILRDHLRRWMLYILAFLDVFIFLNVAPFFLSSTLWMRAQGISSVFLGLKMCSGDDNVKVKVDACVYERSPYYHI
ncbi:hypothetical protein FHETE_2054 [Fusarium heterosporum]|uniref:Uncharacterized protein n=1 Tax=Fusarium heterosporum TaxID=42747 RepID=A0A8H5TW43_FUSHE|nr:hypothetical protein FHETE_2054 [Fusarium heterosporum]